MPARARDEIEFVRNLADGIAMTEKALLTCFERHQIAKVTPELGEKFDHNRHQAMFEVESTEQPPGTVAQVLQPGYTIADRLLRPALVGVAKAPPGKAPGPDAAAQRATGGERGTQARPGERIDTHRLSRALLNRRFRVRAGGAAAPTCEARGARWQRA